MIINPFNDNFDAFMKRYYRLNDRNLTPLCIYALLCQMDWTNFYFIVSI